MRTSLDKNRSTTLDLRQVLSNVIIQEVDNHLISDKINSDDDSAVSELSDVKRKSRRCIVDDVRFRQNVNTDQTLSFPINYIVTVTDLDNNEQIEIFFSINDIHYIIPEVGDFVSVNYRMSNASDHEPYIEFTNGTDNSVYRTFRKQYRIIENGPDQNSLTQFLNANKIIVGELFNNVSNISINSDGSQSNLKGVLVQLQTPNDKIILDSRPLENDNIDNFDGLIYTQILVDKINDLVNQVDQLKSYISNHMHTSSAPGSPSSPPITPPTVNFTRFNKNDIENPRIIHK